MKNIQGNIMRNVVDISLKYPLFITCKELAAFDGELSPITGLNFTSVSVWSAL